ncbi:MAG: restriction endonuclease [Planctomycetes bacterium]|nr:restriction endonuclease [Planctomycetota bacterium]
MAKIEMVRIGEYLQTALKILKDNGGQMASRDVMDSTGQTLKLTEYEKESFEKTGYIRWQSILHLYSINCVKAGWLRKNKGIWYITNEGIDALKLSPGDFIKKSNQKYREWKQKQTKETPEIQDEVSEEISRKTAFEQSFSNARADIEDYIKNLDPYEFQDLVAALLRGMGYHTPFVAPRGRDGGFDILAYKDPFGSVPPRIKVQVKHRDQKISVNEARELASLLNKPDETGLIVSMGGFTSEAEAEIRRSSRHIEMIDLDEFINLWEEHYDKMKEEDRDLMPLRWVAYLAPVEGRI